MSAGRLSVLAALIILHTGACKVVKPPAPQYVQYGFDQAEPAPGQDDLVDEAVRRLTDKPELHVLVVGHTDFKGSDEYNQELSLRRAEGIKDRLVDRGVARTRIEWAARGESEPIAGGDTAEARAKNRRVELFYFYPSEGPIEKQYGFELVFGS